MKSKDINFEYIEEFVGYIIDEVEKDEDKFVTVIAKFDEAKEILKGVMLYENVSFESLQIESPIMDNYEDEFVLSFWMNDGVLEIGCEKLKNENGSYSNSYGDIVFLFDNCSSKIIPLCKDSDLYFVNIDGKCECEENCDSECLCDCHKDDRVECIKTDNGDIHGFSASRTDDKGYYSYSFYTSDSLNRSEISNMLKDFGF